MNVYVVEQGVYHERRVIAVCATLDEAKRQGPAEGWEESSEGIWHNEAPGELNSLRITEWTVEP